VSGIRIARFGGFVNAYLVDEDDGMTLIDTTFGRGAAKAILSQAKRPIVRIVLTHAHQDHVGGLDALAAELPDAEVLISARDAKLMAGDNSPEPGEPAGDKIRGYGANTMPTRTIAPGERIGSLEVIAAPGHTPGQLAFLDTRDRTLFAADAYTTLGGVATTAKPNPRFPLPAMSTWHRPTALETARNLRALDPTRLAAGHGKIVESPGAAMDAAIARAS
jgi:glyoxylase-like metal-dependent hydrolase (beta-lactamase superfamily II)